MEKKNKNSIYNPDNLLRYDCFVNVRFVEEKQINDIDHVVMIDKCGTKKTVYKSLFDKYAKVMD